MCCDGASSNPAATPGCGEDSTPHGKGKDSLAAVDWEILLQQLAEILPTIVKNSVRAAIIQTFSAYVDLAVVAPLFAAGTAQGGDGNALPQAPAAAAVPVSIPPSRRWYLVTRGRQVGIFQGTHIAQPLVAGLSGAVMSRVASHREGLQLYAEAVNAGVVHVIDDGDMDDDDSSADGADVGDHQGDQAGQAVAPSK